MEDYLFINKKKLTTDTHNNMDESQIIMLSEGSQPPKQKEYILCNCTELQKMQTNLQLSDRST